MRVRAALAALVGMYFLTIGGFALANPRLGGVSAMSYETFGIGVPPKYNSSEMRVIIPVYVVDATDYPHKRRVAIDFCQFFSSKIGPPIKWPISCLKIRKCHSTRSFTQGSCGRFGVCIRGGSNTSFKFGTQFKGRAFAPVDNVSFNFRNLAGLGMGRNQISGDNPANTFCANPRSIGFQHGVFGKFIGRCGGGSHVFNGLNGLSNIHGLLLGGTYQTVGGIKQTSGIEGQEKSENGQKPVSRVVQKGGIPFLLSCLGVITAIWSGNHLSRRGWRMGRYIAPSAILIFGWGWLLIIVCGLLRI